MDLKKIYIIGSLRSPNPPAVASFLREQLGPGVEVFDDWYAAGEHADDSWRDYEQERGHTFAQALGGYAARHVFEYDRKHLNESDVVVLVLPAGRSGHLEFGWAMGKGKTGIILLEEPRSPNAKVEAAPPPERWDVMYNFATAVVQKEEELVKMLKAMRAMWAIRVGPPPTLYDGV